jgi:ATP-dependent protease ClpP protease subunit
MKYINQLIIMLSIYLLLTILFTTVSSTNNIELSDNNFASLRGQINLITNNNVIKRLMEISPHNNKLYIFIHSEGGDVLAGLQLMNYMKTLQLQGKEINCISSTAISMAFVIMQQCTKRYVLPYSILMQHQMSLNNGISGELHKINSQTAHINSIENELNTLQADRIGISVEEFTKLILNEWWLTSTESIKNNIADEIVSFTCNFPFQIETINNLEYSKCPIIATPLNKIHEVEVNGEMNNKNKKNILFP